jgi:hypothetical protein
MQMKLVAVQIFRFEFVANDFQNGVRLRVSRNKYFMNPDTLRKKLDHAVDATGITARIEDAVDPVFQRDSMGEPRFLHRPGLAMDTWCAPAPWSYEVVRCNHYYTRSMEDWVVRTKNRTGHTVYSARPEFRSGEFHRHEGDIEDRTILRFADRLKTALAF